MSLSKTARALSDTALELRALSYMLESQNSDCVPLDMHKVQAGLGMIVMRIYKRVARIAGNLEDMHLEQVPQTNGD